MLQITINERYSKYWGDCFTTATNDNFLQRSCERANYEHFALCVVISLGAPFSGSGDSQ